MTQVETETTSDYFVGATIGQGSFGTVLLGKHKRSNQDVAIKVFDKCSLMKHPKWLSCVLNEQRILRKLNDCSYTVHLFASFHDQECVYMVMECCHGGDLKNLIQQNYGNATPADISEAVQLLSWEILQAIEAIHAQHIIHADLKPENILLTRDAHIRIADFGSAVDLSAKSNDCSCGWHGSSEYASPEVIQAAQTLTPAVDIWSFGCILHALWTGESPFHMSSECLAVERVLAFSANPTISICSTKVPLRWQTLIFSLLCPSPNHRPAVNGDFTQIQSFWGWKNTPVTRGGAADIILPETPWLSQSKGTAMRDGSLGWMAFML